MRYEKYIDGRKKEKEMGLICDIYHVLQIAWSCYSV